MKDINTPLCPECGGECTELSEKDIYSYKGGEYLYDSHYWRCLNGHEFQMGDQVQKSLDQCKVIQEMVNS